MLEETTMKIALLTFSIAAAMLLIGSPAMAQNYPWCAYWHGTGGARNCGFVSFAQCMQTAMGAGADCRANVGYEPNKPMR
jgi:Protein of unknown function (DUF3551)